MKRVLFVSNGNGEAAIVGALARACAHLDQQLQCDHLALVGEPSDAAPLHSVGPRRRMPSGGLIAMGNVRNLARDLGSGLLGLTFAQWRFLRSAAAAYSCVVAVGDSFALWMSQRANLPTLFVGTAKSLYVAPYGPYERRLLRRTLAAFVRDEATAAGLRARGVPAQAPGNVISDLFAFESVVPVPLAGDPRLVLLPGSRGEAYDDAVMLVDIVAQLVSRSPQLGALLSVAPTLDLQEMIKRLRASGRDVVMQDSMESPFAIRMTPQTRIIAWRASLGASFANATLVIGQAGTANEAAAAAGLPIVAVERAEQPRISWYRLRQRGLLGDALMIASGDCTQVAQMISGLLDDPARMNYMGKIGRERMGAPGGIQVIAQAICELAR